MVVIQLIYNLAILTSASVLSGFIDARWNRKDHAGKILQGIIFGFIAILAMLNPFVLSPGVIFDGRSIVLSLCALFFGPIGGIIAGLMATIVRIIIGGGGTIMGVSVIASSTILGILYHVRRHRKQGHVSSRSLYLFGLMVHIAMILLMFLLPANFVWVTFQTIAISVIIFYPAATVIIGKILIDQESNITLFNDIRESEKKYRTLVQYSSDPIFAFNPDETYRFVNEAFSKPFGKSPEEIIGHTPHSIFSKEEAEKRLALVRKVFKTGDRGEIDVKVVTKSGEEKYYLTMADPIKNDAGIVLWVSCISKDITERKRAEQLLTQEKERLSVTLHSIGDGVITTDTGGKIVMLNKAAEEMTGWRTEDALGRPLPEVFAIRNSITREICENPVEKVLKTGIIVELANHTCLISKDGREIMIADSGAPIRDKDDHVFGVVLVFRDMTVKHKLSESMQRAQKLESLGVLAGGIAHDFNNMLGGIFGYLELAKDAAGGQKFDKVIPYLTKALGVFERAKGLTQQLLTFSKGGTPVRKTERIAPIIRHSANFALSGSNVTCEFQLPDDLWLCECDENQIGQVIDNLVINAKQAMPQGGHILIRAENVANESGHACDYVRVSIQDHGMGISKTILDKIFDPFFSTKEAGHGLGLATVYSIIQRHDGFIDVESIPGSGSTFHVYIPASQKTPHSGAGDENEEHKGNGAILIMDDEKFMREIVGTMLQEMGYTVGRAKDGAEALALFTQAEKSGQPFLAAILDLTIAGGIGGKETAAAMRHINPHCIIVASSGYSEDPVISDPTLHGFTDKIIKPYKKTELIRLMIRISKQLGGTL